MVEDLESSIEVCAFKPLSGKTIFPPCASFFANKLNTNLCHYTCFATYDPYMVFEAWCIGNSNHIIQNTNVNYTRFWK